MKDHVLIDMLLPLFMPKSRHIVPCPSYFFTFPVFDNIFSLFFDEFFAIFIPQTVIDKYYRPSYIGNDDCATILKINIIQRIRLRIVNEL